MKKRNSGRFSWPLRRRSAESGRPSQAKRRGRLLNYESLEERMLLATDVQIRLSFTDTANNSLSSVQVGQEFLLTATVQDRSTEGAGVAKAYFNLGYGADLADLVSISGTTVFHSDKYSITSDGTNVVSDGTLTSVGGQAASSASLTSPTDPLPLFSIHMQATAVGTLNFTATESTLTDAIQLFVTGSTDLTTVPYTNVEIVGANYSSDLSITVVEAGPAVTGFTRYVELGTPATFAAKDFAQNFLNLVEGENDLQYIKITTLPTSGALKFDGAAATVNQVIAVGDISKLVYTPTSNEDDILSSATFSWVGSADGSNYAADAAAVALVVMETEFNMPPDYVASISKSIPSGSKLSFTKAEFDNVVMDYDLGDALATVTITALPTNGELKLNGTAVTVDQAIAAADLGSLSYRSNTGYTGTDSFAWNASDGADDGTGSALSDSTVTLTVTERTGNAAPTLTDAAVSVAEDGTLSFTTEDIAACFNDADGDAIQTVKVVSLPAHGTLKLSGTAVTVDQEIDADAVGSLTYQPNADYSGTDSFQWNGSDGMAYAAAAATATITVTAVNDAPTLAVISNPAAITEDSDTQSIALTGISAGGGESQTLQVTVSSNNTALTGTPTVTYLSANTTGTVTYSPVANQSGTATITVTVTDAGFDESFGTSDDRSIARQFTVTVTAVNDAPSVSSSTKPATEDTALAFAASDFTANFSDVDSDSLQAVKITRLPYHGTLKLSGTAVTLDQVITAADLANLTYQGNANFSGTDSFQWNGSDGTAYAASATTLTITVTGVSDAPTVSGFTQSIPSAGTATFTSSDFTSHFTDPDSTDSLQKVKITQLPSHGTLKLSGTAVTLNQEIALASLANLTYTMTTGSTGLDTMTWNGTDGTSYAASSAVISFALSADVPTLTNSSKTIAVNATLSFTVADFTGHFTDPGSNGTLETVKIVALPAYGTLYLDGTAVTAGQEIAKANLAKLTYVSSADYVGTVTLSWNGTNGKAYAETDATISIACVVDVPTVSNLSLNLAQDTTLAFTEAQFTSCFSDSNPSHSLTSVQITTLPSHGTLYLNGTAVTTDQVIAASSLANLTYTPTSGYTGADTIKWKGSDGTTYSTSAATITVTSVADVPVVSAFGKTVATGSTLTFTASEFTSHFTDYNSAHSLQNVMITALPSHGTLKLSGTAVTANQVVAASSLASLTYTPTSGYTGADTIQWKGTDGTTYAATAATITVTVVSEIPTVSNSSKTIATAATLTFSPLDFTSCFTDTTSTHSLQTVKITALPTNGTLLLDGAAVTVNQEIAAVDLGKLTYASASSYTGSDTVTWIGSDGSNYSTAGATITITVKTDTPTLTAFTKTTATASTLTFSISDFTSKFSDANPSHSLQKVKITALPTSGTLKLLGSSVTAGQEIAYADLANLTYVAASSTGTATISWNASDGASYAATASTITITVNADTPVAGAFGKTVAKNATLTFTVADFTGHFTDYNAAHSLQLVKFTALPTHGTLRYNGAAVTTSQVFAVADLAKITYKPNTDYTGSDTFTWTGSDGTTYSSGATVTLTAVADVPVVSDFAKTVAVTTSSTSAVLFSFTAADFTGHFTDYAADSLTKVKITQLPSHGTLKLSGTAVTLNQEIALADLANLTYQTNVNFVGADTVKWSATDGTTYSASSATITLTSVPNVPTVSDVTKTVVAGTTVSFTATDFTAAFATPAGDALKVVKITQLPIHGTLYLDMDGDDQIDDGETVTVNQEINAGDLANLNYVPTSSSAGYNDAFKWTGMGSPYSANESTVTLATTADLPTLTSFTKTILVGASYTFSSSDFTTHYSASDSLTKVKVTQLPSYGTLKLNSNTVTLNQEIALADLGSLVYTSTSTSATTDTIGWNASDGTSYAASSATVVFNAVIDVPTVSDSTKTVAEDTTLSFTAADFTDHFTDLDSTHSLQKVKITALPTHGTLKLSGTAVTLNQEITAANLANLTYVGNSDYNGSDTFTWVASDGTTYATSPATVTITVSAVNDLPTVTNFSKTVATSGTLTFASTDFSNKFTDVDSDALQTVKITALPSHGTLKLSGTAVTVNQEITAANLANLTYSPTSGYSGSDTFTWTGSDGTGYATTASTVTISVGTDTGTGSISGSVFLDADNDGAFDSTEIGLAGVAVQLLQKDGDGAWTVVVATTLTDANGAYSFDNLAAGTYKLAQPTQPSCYVDGIETAGTLGGTADNDSIYDITLDTGENGTGYLFGEKSLSGNVVSRRLFLKSTLSRSEIVASLNKAPTVDLNGSSTAGTGSSATYSAGGTAVAIAANATIADTDGGWLKSMTITITNRSDGDSEVLAATTTDTDITASYSGGVLTLSGVASIADYQTVLRSVTYTNSDTTPTTGARTINVIASDGIANTGTSEIVTATVTVTDSSSSTTPTVTLTAVTTPTNDTTPTLSGTAGNNDGSVTVKIYSGSSTSGTLTQTLTATVSSGTYSVTPTTALAAGTYTAVASQTNTSGTGTSSTVTFVVDTTVPTVTLTAVTTPTNDSTPTFNGTAVTGDGSVTVKIYSGSSATGTAVQTLSATVSSSAYSVTPTTALAAGTYTAVASQTDSAGNTGTSSTVTFVVDTTAPTVTLTSVTTPTNDTTPTFSGTAVTGDGSVTVKIYSGSSTSGTLTQTLSATVSSGAYSVTPTTVLAAGTYTAVASQTDTAGNTGTSSTVTFVVDTTAPTVTLASITTPTNDTTPTFSGTAVTGDGSVTVKIYSGSSTSGTLTQTLTATVSSGVYSVTSTTALAAGTYTAVASQTDSASNTGTSSTVTFVVDTTAPTVTLASITTPTNDATPTFAGTAVTGDGSVTVKIYSGSSATGTAVQTLTATVSSGAYSVTSTTALADGTYTAVASQTDSASNTGTSSTVTFVVDATAPTVALTAITTPTNDATPTFVGTAVTGDGSVTVKIYSGSSATGTAVQTLSATVSSSAYSVTSSTALADGTYTAVASQTDSAGNTGTSSTATFVVDTVAPTVTISRAAGQSESTTDSTVNFTVVFIEQVSNFDGQDVTLKDGQGNPLSFTVAATDSGDGKTYNVVVSNITGSGTLIASIAAGVAEDQAGNANTAAGASASVTYAVTSATASALSAAEESNASVVQDGTEVVVTGATGADTIEFVATADQYVLTVNGATYYFSTSEVTAFSIDGNGGDDTVALTGDDSDQTAVLSPNAATFQGAGFTVNVSNAKQIGITAGSGDSEAHLYDSVGDDALEAANLVASLTGDGFANTLTGFKRVTASATAGGQDTASVSAVDFLLSQDGDWL